MERIVPYLIALGYFFFTPSDSMGLEGDASYSNTDGTAQVAAQGKHWLGSSLRINGRYNKVDGKPDRYSYGLLSRHYRYNLVIEGSGIVYDTHQSLSGSVGLGGKRVTFSAGGHREYVDGAPDINLASFTARLTKVGWSFGDGRGTTIEAKYSYLINQDKVDRHDYKAEGRFTGKHIYIGARYEHVRDVIIQGVFVGASF
jgi:hypothetical protein